MGINSLKHQIKNPFVKSVLTLLTGATFAQLIPILFTPILLRMYTQDEFGIFLLFISIFSVLSVIVTLRYELALVLPQKDSEASVLFKVGNLLSFIISFVFLFIIFFGYDTIKNVFEDKNIGTWLYYIPLATFLFGSSQMFNYWNNRFKNYKTITKAKIARAITVIAIQVLTWYIGYSSFGLFWGYIAGILAMLVIYLYSLKSKGIKSINKVSFYGLQKLLKRYKNIPSYNTLLILSTTLSSHLPLIILTKYFGIEVAANFGLTIRVLSTPITLIGQSIAQVFYKEAAERINKGLEVKPLLVKLYKKLFLFSLIPMLIILFFGKWLFGIVFGNLYADAGVYAQILAPFMLLNMLNVPVSGIITNLNKQKQMLGLSLFWLIIKIAGIWLGYYYYYDVIKSLVLYSGASVLHIAIILFYYYHISKKPQNFYK